MPLEVFKARFNELFSNLIQRKMSLLEAERVGLVDL